MKHQIHKPAFCSHALFRIGMLLAFTAMLAGCNTPPQPTKKNIKQVKSQKRDIKAAKPVVVDARQVRADFDAAMGFIKAEKYDKGIELLTKVTDSEKNNSVPYTNLAMAYIKAGDQKLAEEYFKAALNIDPDNPVANNEYALLYRRTGRFAEARHLYEKALEKYPGFNIARKNLGILCDIYMRDYDCALKNYEIYSSAVPGDKAAKIWIADIKERLTRQE